MTRKISDETLKFTVVINGNEGQKEYNKLTRANGKLLDANKDLEKQAKRLSRSRKANADAIAKVRSQIERNNKTISENDKRMGALTKEIGLNNLSQVQLRKTARKLAKELDSLNPNTPKYTELSGELSKVRTRMDELRKSSKSTFDSMESQLGVLDEFKSGVGGIFNSFRSGDVKGAQEGLKGLKAGFKGAAKAALALVLTPVGAFLAVLAGIVLITKQWVKYNEAIRETTLLTQQITKQTGDVASDIRNRNQAITDTFGGDFKKNLEAARGLVKEFGITYTEAFNEIEEGLVRGGSANEEFLESVEEYDVFFAKAKFSVTEFRKLINTGIDLGIYKDKLPDAIKEFDISIREQTKGTQDALINAFGKTFTKKLLSEVKKGEISTKQALIQIAEQSKKTSTTIQQNAQLTADLFRGAGEDVGGAAKIIEAVNMALVDQEKALTPLEAQLKRVSKANTQLAEAQSEALESDNYVVFSNRISLFWKKIKTTFFQGISFITDQFNKWQRFSLRTIVQIIAVVRSLPVVVRQAFVDIIKEAREATISILKFGEVLDRIAALDYTGAKKAFKDYTANVKKEFIDVGKVGTKTAAVLLGVAANAGSVFNDQFDKEAKGAIDAAGNKPPEGGTPAGENKGLSAEDQKRLASRKRLLEQIAALEAEQQLLEDQKVLDDISAKEIAELEAIDKKFAKLEADAANEAELLAQLEELKQNAVQEVQDRYGKARDAKKADDLKKEAELQKKKKLLEEQELKRKIALEDQKFKQTAKTFGGIAELLGKETAAGKAAAIAQATINTYQGVTEVWRAKSVLPEPFATASKIANTAVVLGSGLEAVKQIKKQDASVDGFEDGLFPVVRNDGKTFDSALGGNPSTQIVSRPTLFNGPFLAGEAGASRPEMIIDGNTFNKLDPSVIGHILRVAGRTQGFEQGMASKRAQSTSTDNVSEREEMSNMMGLFTSTMVTLNERLEEPLEAQVLFGYKAEKERNESQRQLKRVREQAKIN